jgi:transposase
MTTGFIKQNVGIDVAKDDFKVNFSVMKADLDVVIKGSKTIKNDQKGFEELEFWTKNKSIGNLEVHFTMEATGVYYESLAYFLQDKGYTVHVVLPNQAKKYGQSLGVESKTDEIDAKTLARLGLERKLREWKPFSPNFLVLKQLIRERDALIQDRTAALNQLHAYTSQGRTLQASVKRSEEHINLLTAQIEKIEQEIKQVVDNDKPLKKRLNYVLSIKGVALITAVTIVAETNGFATINNIKQLTSYAGLDIKLRESGKWKGKAKISKKGNKFIRKSLYFPTFSKITHDKMTKEKYEKLKEKKGVSMVAAVAQQRKLLALIYTLWKKQEMFVPNYESINIR